MFMLELKGDVILQQVRRASGAKSSKGWNMVWKKIFTPLGTPEKQKDSRRRRRRREREEEERRGTPGPGDEVRIGEFYSLHLNLIFLIASLQEEEQEGFSSPSLASRHNHQYPHHQNQYPHQN